MHACIQTSRHATLYLFMHKVMLPPPPPSFPAPPPPCLSSPAFRLVLCLALSLRASTLCHKIYVCVTYVCVCALWNFSKCIHDVVTLCLAGGKQVILYGGEGHELIDGAGGQPPNVYTLDVASLTWHRRSTTCGTPHGSPGVRSLHIATVSTAPRFLYTHSAHCQQSNPNVNAPSQDARFCAHAVTANKCENLWGSQPFRNTWHGCTSSCMHAQASRAVRSR